MSFLSPLMLVGVLAASVPLVIHLIGRRRAPRRPFAAIDFVLRSNRKLARRLRLRQLLVLALRMVLVGGLAVMLSRPFFETPSDLPAVSAHAQSAVLLLDDTLSMGHGGGERFAAARRKAHELVEMIGSSAGSDLALLRVTDPSGPVGNLTRDLRQVREAIARVGLTALHATATRAVVRAGRLLQGSSRKVRSIYLISDLAAHGLPSKLPRLPEGVSLRPVAVRPAQEPANSAVVQLKATASSAPGVRATRLSARICNHSPRARSHQVTLLMAGSQVARGQLKLGSWACEDKTFEHAFGRGGVQHATVHLDPDALTPDDRRDLLLEVESTLRVLLVNGAPSPVRHLDELFYLETALATAGKSGQPIRVRQVVTADFAREDLSGHDVVVLANVRALAPAPAAALGAFVRKGGGLLVGLGDQVDAPRLNQALAGLLPQELRGKASTSPGAASADLRLGRLDTTHPIIAALWSRTSGGGLQSARFSRTFRLRPATRLERRVMAWFDDGSPALLEATRGDGRVVLFTSSLDRDWNDLAIRPGFAPLVQQLVRYLGRGTSGDPLKPLEVGATAKITPPRGATLMVVADPGGQERRWADQSLQGAEPLAFTITRPGLHRVSFAGADGVIRSLPRQSFVANVNPQESDLRPRAAAGALAEDGAPRVKAMRRVELWHGLAALLLALVLLEALILRRS